MWFINVIGLWFKVNVFEIGMWVLSWYVNCYVEGD